MGIGIKITSKMGANKYLIFLRTLSGELSVMAKLVGDIEPLSCGYNHESKLFIRPFRGPTLTEGEPIPNSTLKVRKIHYSYEQQYYIVETQEL